jgi:hypothetical protein
MAALKQIRERLLKAGENYWAQQVEIQELEVGAWAVLAESKKEEALRQMKSAAELEDGTDKSAVTPGPLAPARELLGEMLLEMKEPAQALEQFEATPWRVSRMRMGWNARWQFTAHRAVIDLNASGQCRFLKTHVVMQR